MFEELTERSNRAALILANERYHEQLKPWVRASAIRLAYVEKDIERIVFESVEETGGNFDYVLTRFKEKLAEEVENTPRGKGNEENPVLVEQGVKRDDPLNKGGVDGLGLEEALKPEDQTSEDLGKSRGPGTQFPLLQDAVGDTDKGLPEWKFQQASNLKDASTWPECYRCSKKLNPVYAAVSPVCRACTQVLSDSYTTPHDLEDSDHNQQPAAIQTEPLDSALFQCSVCRDAGQLVKGTHDELLAHVRDSHQDVLDKENEESELALHANKLADVPEDKSDIAEVQPTEDQPADRFDDLIQDLADRAAAEQFSSPSEEEINQLAGQYQADAETIRNSIYATAMFGKYTGVNGTIGQEVGVPQNYTEITAGDFGGQVKPQEALVPTNLVVQKVADEMGMEPDLVYNMVRDRYGADLPDKYHASVSGEHHFYLPQEIAANQQQAQQPPQQQAPAPPVQQQQPVPQM